MNNCIGIINLDENESSVKEKVHSTLEGKLDGKSIVKEIYVKNNIYTISKLQEWTL